VYICELQGLKPVFDIPGVKFNLKLGQLKNDARNKIQQGLVLQGACVYGDSQGMLSEANRTVYGE
jgi:hypothetical protein